MEPFSTQFLTDFPTFFDEKRAENAQKNVHSCDYWNALGCAAFAAGNYADALKFFSDAIHLSDQYHHYIHYECAAVYILRAKWHMEHENWDAAKVDLKAAIFQDHGSVAALSLRIWIAEHIDNNPQDSAKFTQQLRRFAPDAIVPTRWRDIADYREMLADDSAWQSAVHHKDYPLAVHSETAHDKALGGMADNPQLSAELLAQVLRTPRAWRHYGEALMKSGRLPEAKEALDKAEAEHKRWHSAYHRAAASHRINRGLTYEKLGDVVMAWQECAKAADIDKDWQAAKEQTERLSKLAMT